MKNRHFILMFLSLKKQQVMIGILQAWNMLVALKDFDKEAQDKLTAAMKKVYVSGELAEFANKQGFEVIELYG